MAKDLECVVDGLYWIGFRRGWKLAGSYMSEHVDRNKCGEEIEIKVQMMESHGS